MKRASQPSLDWGPANQSDKTGRYAITHESRDHEMRTRRGILPRTRLHGVTQDAPTGNTNEPRSDRYYDNEGYRESYSDETF